ncbi:MAG: arylesterase [Chromatiales bacterium]|jgi:acyl-CoA thioesterase-1|nr:arylesterase [Chromatiales bacterium]
MPAKLLLLFILVLGTPIASAQTPVVLVLGDSLSAAYGIDREKGWVSLLQQRLTQTGHQERVVNASISGEATSGGLARLARELDLHTPEIVIVELGGNDGLRGLSLDQTRNNLSAIITTAQKQRAHVLLIGMQLPPNYGSAYTAAFQRIYADLAAKHTVALVPFLLDRLNYDQFQNDGIHPIAAAQPILLDNVWPQLEKLLEKPPAH